MANKGWEKDLHDIGMHDANELIRKDAEYGSSWKARGGIGAFMMLARKFDRLENISKLHGYDIFAAIKADRRKDGPLDDIADLRRYLMLVEAEVMSWGHRSVEQENPFGFDPKLDCQNERQAAE